MNKKLFIKCSVIIIIILLTFSSVVISACNCEKIEQIVNDFKKIGYNNI